MPRPATRTPQEPTPTPYDFSVPPHADELVASGGDLEPGTVLAAYRSGLFPMPLRGRLVGWWSPDPRGVLPLDALRVSRSLRRARGRFEVRVDTAFDAVLDACADPSRPHGWITRRVRRAYAELHRLGWAHSVEAWTADGVLAGGLYGVEVGGLFAGESMFHVPRPQGRDASKVALVALVELLRSAGGGGRLLDVQWATPHLVSLGAREVARDRYLRELLPAALRLAPAVGGSVGGSVGAASAPG